MISVYFGDEWAADINFSKNILKNFDEGTEEHVREAIQEGFLNFYDAYITYYQEKNNIEDRPGFDGYDIASKEVPIQFVYSTGFKSSIFCFDD